MKPYFINDKKNFISGWYINENLCDSIVEECLGKNRLRFRRERKPTVRGYLWSNLKSLSEELQMQYQLELDKVINFYIEEYSILKKINKFEIYSDKNSKYMQIQIYDPNFSYSDLHCENNGDPYTINRCLVFMTYLNTVDEGGGTYFPYQDLSTKAEKGLTLIWPAYWTHPHCGIVSKSQTKIIATGWYTFQNSG